MKTTREPLSDENREKLFVRIKDENVSIHERADMVRILEWDDALRAALERAEKAEREVEACERTYKVEANRAINAEAERDAALAKLKTAEEALREIQPWGESQSVKTALWHICEKALAAIRSEDFPLRDESDCGCNGIWKYTGPHKRCDAEKGCIHGTPPKTVPDNQMDYPPAAVHLDRSMVSVHGSDGCSSCDTGRITIYAASRQCLDCRTRRPTRTNP